jgi:hypothetical protein
MLGSHSEERTTDVAVNLLCVISSGFDGVSTRGLCPTGALGADGAGECSPI